MKKYVLVLSIALLFFSSCNKDRNDFDLKYSGYQIILGSICGWCAGGDSLLITETKTHYEFSTPCDDLDKKIERSTNKQDWEELIDLLNFDEFQKIDINTCNVCADGCDTWITVHDGTITHTIRYGYDNSLTVHVVQPFIDKLLAIRDGINANARE